MTFRGPHRVMTLLAAELLLVGLLIVIRSSIAWGVDAGLLAALLLFGFAYVTKFTITDVDHQVLLRFGPMKEGESNPR